MKQRSSVFPGGARAGRELPLRLAVDRKPMSDLLAHCAETPDIEICGVLVGYQAKDDGGPFVHITASIRGEKAREQGSHVTFTHETWNYIHSEMDRKHAGLEIVGWYHTHPGFGVFLSDMDSFIQKNFFGQPHQVALVHDPLAGKTGVFVTRGEELIPLPLYWRDGRAIPLDTSAAQAAAPSSESEVVAEVRQLREAIRRVEQAVGARERGWVEEWLVPSLLLVLLGLGLLQYLYPPRVRLGFDPWLEQYLRSEDARRNSTPSAPQQGDPRLPQPGRR